MDKLAFIRIEVWDKKECKLPPGVYWGHPMNSNESVWDFQMINGISHFRAIGTLGSMFDLYEDHHMLKRGIVIGYDKDIYGLLH